MNRCLRYLMLVLVTGLCSADAQVTVTLNLRSPLPSQISVWERDPTVVQAIITNTTRTNLPNLRAAFTIRDIATSQIVAHSDDNHPGIPRFTLAAGAVLVRNGPTLINADAVTVDQSLRTITSTTGSLPEGTYEFCVTILAEDGTVMSPVPACRVFTILIPDPPTLILPANGDSLAATFTPTFTWTPVFVAPGLPARYRLVLSPIYTGQTPKNAIEQNTPLLSQLVSTTSYYYAPSNPQFSLYPTAKGFAWQVTALDASGQPATRNEGKSEIFFFVRKPQGGVIIFPPILPGGPQLVFPDNNSVLSTLWFSGKVIQFAWKYPSQQDVKCRLRLVRILPGQSPAIALTSNVSHYFPDVQPGFGATSATEIQQGVTRVSFPMLAGGNDYAWQVQIIQPSGAVSAVSEIRKFTYSGPSAGLWATSAITGTLKYLFADSAETATWPLAHAKVKLVVSYKAVNPVNNWVSASVVRPKDVLFPGSTVKVPPDWNTVLGVGTTDASGNFAISFIQTDSTGVNRTVSLNTYGGTAYYRRIFRLELEGPHVTYLTGPADDIIIQPGQAKFLGALNGKARSYKLTVTVRANPNDAQQQLPKGDPIPGMEVFLLRKIRPLGVPVNEGSLPQRNPGDPPSMMNLWLSSMEVVAKGETPAGANKGKVVFTRAVKNVGPNDTYYLFTRSSENSIYHYNAIVPVAFKYGITYPSGGLKDEAVSADEFAYASTATDLIAYPLKPSISGTVRTTETLLPLANATVVLMNPQSFMGIENVVVTDSTGRFVFSNLPTTYNSSGQPTGPTRSLLISRKGYASRSWPIGILQPGMKFPEKPYVLEPLSDIVGKIVDASGNGVSANVRVVGGESKDFDPPLIFVNFKRVPVPFQVQAPKGENTIIVDPTAFAPTLLPETLKVNVTTKVHDLGLVTLKPRQYRLVVEVHEKGLTLPGQGPKLIPGAQVRLEDKSGNAVTQPGGQALAGTTNSAGQVSFGFFNSAGTIVAAVSGPPDKNYLPARVSVQPSLSSKPDTLVVKLTRGTSISGYVYAGGQNTPVPGVEVALKSGTTQDPLVATTDSSGYFILKNIPIGTRTYVARKKQSNLIGEEKTLTVPAAGLQNVTFSLTPYTAMDLSRILGFPVAVDALSESGGEVRISGRFVDLHEFGNPQFASTGQLSFSNLPIIPGTTTGVVFGQTVPVARPKFDSVVTNENSLPLKIFGKYNATLRDQQAGIVVAGLSEVTGAIRGTLLGSAGSFQATYFSVQGDEFVLRAPGVEGLRVPTITSSKTAPLQIPGGLAVSGPGGVSLSFRLYDFAATADSSTSRLTQDSLHLVTTVHTNLLNVTPKDVNMKIGRVSFAPGMTALGPIIPQQAASLQLDTWTLQLESMMLYGQISVTKGTLKTPTVSVPIKKLTISPTQFISSEFALDQLSLAGVVPLIVKKSPILNYDPTITQWILGAADASGVAASIAGLPGMAVGDSIALDAFLLKSKENNPNLSPAPTQQPLFLHKVGKLTPTQIRVYQNQGYVEMTSLSFKVPKATSVTTAVHFLKEGGQTKLSVAPTPIKFPGVGIEVALAETTGTPFVLDAKGLRVRGRVYETGKYSLPVWLFHTIDSTSIWIESPHLTLVSPTPGWTSMPIGAQKTSLEKLVGGMKPLNANAWGNLWFAGDLVGTTGITAEKKRLSFTVVGTVKATNQELGVNNIPTAFGNMEWTFDFEKKRLRGSIPAIDKEMYGAARVKGTAAAVIDGSGWFFVSGGTLELDSPHFKLAAALVIGDYPNMSSAQEFKDVFLVNPKKYTHNGAIPANFTSALSGFYFTGLAELPIPILPPSIDISLDPIVHVTVDYYWGGEFALGMNFAQNKIYYVKAGAFLGASVDVGGSALVACLSGHLAGEVYIYGEGEYNMTTGSWWVEGKAGLVISGGGVVGAGCCDSDCECYLPVGSCSTSSWNDSIDIGFVRVRLGQGGPKFCSLGLCL